MPSLVIVPGMDGTGILLKRFTAGLGGAFEVRVARYPPDRAFGYEELLEVALDAVPEGKPVVLVGESFGGPLALKVAASRRRDVRGVVLVASFARYWGGKLKALRPFVQIAPVVIPSSQVLKWLLTNGRSFVGEDKLRNTLNSLTAGAVKSRVSAALAVNAMAELKELTIPVLCLRATGDRVVPASAAEEVVAAAQSGAVIDVPGPHFLLQCEEERCAERIKEFALRAAF